MNPISFKRHRFPPEVIRYSVWLYFRFTLSIRDVEDVGRPADAPIHGERAHAFAAVNLRCERCFGNLAADLEIVHRLMPGKVVRSLEALRTSGEILEGQATVGVRLGHLAPFAHVHRTGA